MRIRAAYLIRRPIMWQVERTYCDQPSTHFPNSLRNSGQQTCFCLCVVGCMFEGQCIAIGCTVFKLQCFYFCNKLHLGYNKMNSRTAKIQQIPWYSKGIPVLRATKDPPDTESLFSLTVKKYRLLSGIRISNRQEIFQEFRSQQVNHIFLCVTHVTRPYFASVSFWFSTQWFALSDHWWWQKQKKERRLLQRSALRPCHQPMGHQTHPEAMYRMGRGLSGEWRQGDKGAYWWE